jgi:hypothetical protein
MSKKMRKMVSKLVESRKVYEASLEYELEETPDHATGIDVDQCAGLRGTSLFTTADYVKCRRKSLSKMDTCYGLPDEDFQPCVLSRKRLIPSVFKQRISDALQLDELERGDVILTPTAQGRDDKGLYVIVELQRSTGAAIEDQVGAVSCLIYLGPMMVDRLMAHGPYTLA